MTTRKCVVCGVKFEKQRMGQKACSPACAIEQAKIERAAMQRRKDRIRREQLKSKRELAAEAQKAFNEYIRERDRDLPCISCGTRTAGQYHAGHFRTRKAAPQLALGDFLSCLNVNRQCAQCNTYDSGNISGYRLGLVERYGEAVVQQIERANYRAARGEDWYRRCRDIYRRRARHLRRLRQRRAGRINACSEDQF